jgi:hypothetical protein
MLHEQISAIVMISITADTIALNDLPFSEKYIIFPSIPQISDNC